MFSTAQTRWGGAPKVRPALQVIDGSSTGGGPPTNMTQTNQRTPSKRTDKPARSTSSHGAGPSTAGDVHDAAAASLAAAPAVAPPGAIVRRFRRGRWTLTPVWG